MAVFAVDSALSLMNSIIHVRPEVASLREQQSAPPPALEPPADLDAMLDELDSALARFDELTDKDRNFPSELKTIENRYAALSNQEVDSVAAIESRSAEAAKLAAMKELAVVRQKKVKNLIESQQEAAIKLGTQIAGLLEAKWWSNYTRRAEEVRAKFDELFYRSALDQNLQDNYKPLTLLQWLRVPEFRTSRFATPDTKLNKCRMLRQSANQLAEFERMSFAQIADRVEEIDRKSRERLIVPST